MVMSTLLLTSHIFKMSFFVVRNRILRLSLSRGSVRMKLHIFRTMSWRTFTFSALQMSGCRRGTREILKNIFLCQMILFFI